MPQLVIPPGSGYIAMTVANSLAGKPALVTWGFTVDTPPFTQSDATTLSAGLRTALNPLYDTNWVIGPSFLIIGNDGPDFRFDVTNTSNGTRSAQTNPPPQVAALIKKTTGLAGRKFRGRTYLPFGGPATAIDEAGFISGGENTLLVTAATAISTQLDLSSNNTNGQVVLHSVGGIGPTPVISYTVERIVATQRRRLTRRGA